MSQESMKDQAICILYTYRKELKDELDSVNTALKIIDDMPLLSIKPKTSSNT